MELDKLEQLKLELDSKSEKDETSTEDKSKLLNTLVDEYKDAKTKYNDRQSTADTSTAISSIASTLDKYSGAPVGVKAQKFSAGDAPDIGEIINLAKLQDIYPTESKDKDLLLGLKGKKLQAEIDKLNRLKTDKIDPLLGLKGKKLQAEIDKLNRKKDTTKDKSNKFHTELDKAQAKDYSKTQNQARTAGANDSLLDETLSTFMEYTKNKTFGTGPIASGFGLKRYVDVDTEKLDAKFKMVSLDKMTKMFAGMSKAIDSDAERAAFEATQPSIKNDDLTNANIIVGAQAVNLRNKAEALAQSEWVEEHGDLRKYISPVIETPTSVVVSPDGVLKLIPRDKITEFKAKGFMSLDQRAAQMLGDTPTQFSKTQETGISKFMEKNRLGREEAIKVLSEAGRL